MLLQLKIAAKVVKNLHICKKSCNFAHFLENITDIMRKYISLIALLLCVQVLFAVDKSYYSTYVDNKSGATLFTGIHNVAKVGYSSLSYSGLWTAYATTDVYPSGHIYAGKIWDMYGGCEFTYGPSKNGGDQCGTYSAECDCYNREHSIPKSWFGGTEANNTPGSDIFHVVPTDGKVNGMRSNYAFGEVNSASYSYNGSKLGTPKSITIANTLLGDGDVTKSCGSSPVFEPIDEYKGDFARGYFGTMLRWASGDYQTFTSGDGAQMFNTAYDAANYYGLTQYGLALLLKWHRQDPVSQKEIDRNNGIQTTQGNRNPFIDYPILAEYLWGKYAGQTFSLANAVGSFEAGFTPGVSDGDKNGGGTPAVTYTVSWMANGSPFSTSTTLPDDPNNCSDTRLFRGWTGTKNYSGDTAPSDLFTTGNPTITKDTTFYAVYADKSTSESGESNTEKFVFANNGYTEGQAVESATQGDVTITFAKGTNSNAPKYYTSGSAIRCYGGNTITVTATGMTEIVFTFGSSDGSNAITSNVGTFETNTWEGSANEVVFTIGGTSGNRRIAKIDVVIGSGSTTTYSNFSLSCSNSTPTDEAFPGAAPEGYYDAIEGLSDSILKSTLGALTYANFTTRYSYGSGNHNTWHALWSTDRDESDNSVIDMYSNNKRYFNPSDTTASVAGCDIEHMFPNSWWGGKAGNRDAYEDLHHLVPADYSANRSKSNHGPGEPTTITFNNGVWINGNDANRGNIVVFCPSDEYKGDFARAFFYIATTYGDTAVWQKEGITAGHHMTNDSWKEFLPEMSELLLKWHRQDPVSDKERIRMNKVYEIQGNRNPFIDYPCLAEYIWGEKQGQTVSLSSMASAYDAGFFDEGCVATTDPTIIDPTAAQYIGITKADSAITKQIKVRGINLTSGNLTLTLSGANASLFGLSANSISSTDAAKGKVVTITYTPTSNGEHSATLTISGCGVTSHEINLTATCSNLYTATWKVEEEQVLQTKAFSGQMPSLSDEPADCNGNRVFVGWTAQTSVTDLPADLFRDEAPSLTENKTFYAVFADEDKHLDTKGHQDYKFSSNKWAASPSNWINGRSGYAYSSDKGGVQVSQSVSGAYATAPITFTNVDTIKVNYCTNASSGAGSITMYVGDESITKTVDKTGGATLREVLFDFAATRPSGEVVISVECTTNSIYIDSVTVSYSAPATYSNYRLSCSALQNVTITFHKNDGTDVTKTQEVPQSTSTALEANSWSREHYAFLGWATTAGGEKVYNDGASISADTDLDLYAAWQEDPKYTVTFMNGTSVHKAVTGYAGGQITGLTDPTACEGYTFVGWSTTQYAVDNTDEPSTTTPTTIPAVNTTYYAVYSKTEGGGSATTNVLMEDHGAISGTFGDYTFAAEKNNGGTPPAYNENGKDGRLYAKNSLTISTSTAMTQIVFNLSSQGKNRLAPITASVGTIATQASGDETVTWTGSSTAVTFTVGDKASYGSDGSSKAGQLCFLSVDITTGSGPVTYYTTAPDCEPVVQPEYTVIFMDRGEKFYEATGVAGYSFSLPGMNDECTAHSFYGWSGLQYEEHNIDIPSIEDYPTTIPSHDTTYYAVYSKTTNSMSVPTNNYKKITTADELTSAKYLVVADTSYLVAMSSELSGYYPIGVEVTANNADVITTENSAIIWRITVDGSQLTLYNTDKGYLYIEESINNEKTYYNIKIGNNTADNKFTYSVTGGAWTLTSVTYSTRQLEYYQSSKRWAFYTGQDAPIYLYKQQLTSGLLTFYSTNPTCQAGPMTDIDINPTSVEVRKLLIHGQLFILVGDQLFDITGKRVR